MKLFKKILLSLFLIFILSLVGGYLYFDRKFTPDDNYLTVKNGSGPIQIKWEDNDKTALLLPIHFEKDTTTYFMQFDTGSPYTLFYKNSIINLTSISIEKDIAKCNFIIGNCNVSSNKFKIIDFGKNEKKENNLIIGTIGSDILENRKTFIDFKNNYISFNLKETPKNIQNNLFDFKFKKRKIIIPSVLNNSDNNYLYDSGASGHELLTTKENWQNLKLPNSKIKIEKGKSWNNVLTTYSAETNQKIKFQKSVIPLTEVTYVEGFSKTQYYLMKFSGMSGMLGNKIFFEHKIFLDCKDLKMGIE